MKWFGKPYGAPYEADTPHVATPVGEPCLWCNEAIEARDSGLVVHCYPDGERAYHYDCHFRTIIGGLNHLRGRCQCCGGTEPPDPPEMTRRDAAAQAIAYWSKRGRRQ